MSRVNPAASVSSVSGVGAKNPCPTDTRLVHRCQRKERRQPRAEETYRIDYENRLEHSRKRESHGVDVDIVLNKHSGGYVHVPEARNVARRVGVSLNRAADNPRMTAEGASCRELSEEHVVAVALKDFAKDVIVVAVKMRQRER